MVQQDKVYPVTKKEAVPQTVHEEDTDDDHGDCGVYNKRGATERVRQSKIKKENRPDTC